jgi:ElaB/YqjD/DUF883 family membrane-anchored ribosome-binding protein
MARTATPTTNGKDVGQADLNAQIEALKNDIAGLSHTIAELSKAQKNELVASAKGQAQALKTRGDAALQDAQAATQDAYAQAEQAVKDNPAAAVGIATGIGFLVGLIAGRK